MKSSYGNREHGFSLLELLVAFAIMAISLGFIYKAMGTSTRQVADVAALQHATIIMDGLVKSNDSVDAQGLQTTGEEDGFKWQIKSEPFTPEVSVAGSFPLFKITYLVGWTDGTRPKALTVETLLPQRQPMPGERIR